MLIKAICPQCGANLNVDNDREVFFCEYCGCKLVVPREHVEVNHSGEVGVVHSGTITYKKDYSNEPNLHVTYNTVDPSLPLTIMIPQAKIKGVFTNGMSQSFKVTPGSYVIKFKIGSLTKVNKTVERKVTFGKDGSPLRLSVVYQGGMLQKVIINAC